MRILAVWWKFPRVDFNAGDKRFVAILTLLARRHHVDFAVPFHGSGGRRDEGRDSLTRAGVRIVADDWATFSTCLARTPYDIVLFEFHHIFHDVAKVVRARQPAARLIVDSVDVHFAREGAAADIGAAAASSVAANKVGELSVYRAADAVIVVTPEDRALLEHEGGLPALFVIPIVMSIVQRPDVDRPPGVLFVGGFRHAPNLDAVRWFVSDVWPRVLRAMPGAVFTVVGSHPPDDIMALSAQPGVRVLGYVPDTQPFLDEASVSVAPLRYGAGMKGKVNEALASGVPLVTTSFGAQGIPIVSGTHAFIADDATTFADAVVALLQDSAAARRIGMAGQELASAFAPDSVGMLLESMINTLVPKPQALSARARWLAANVRAGFAAALKRVSRSTGPTSTP